MKLCTEGNALDLNVIATG